MSEQSALDERTTELVGIGAAIAGNCLPCLRYHMKEAVQVGCTLEEVRAAVGIARAVKERPIQDIYKLAEDLLSRERLNTERE